MGKRGTGQVDEATLIRRYFSRKAAGDVLTGVGDDAAITRLPSGLDLVTAMDTMVEGVHFPRGMPPRSLGHRSLAINLSDLAAMGARPLWATLSLSLPSARSDWLHDFSSGFFALARRYGVRLIGGDTVRGPLNISVTALGCVKPRSAVHRSDARPGDDLYVTGAPGDAVAGRLLLDRGGSAGAVLRQRFLYPEPRLAAGRALVGVASAMIDVSDGLHDDLGKLLRASGVGADADAAMLPLSSALRRLAGPERGRLLALTGGDDYELLFSAPPEAAARIRRIASRVGCEITRIGCVVPRRTLRWMLNGRRYRFADGTFRHFS